MTYVGPSQVLVKPLTNDANVESSHGVILKSQYGHEIEDVRVMGDDRYLIGRTRDTLLLGMQFILNNFKSIIFKIILHIPTYILLLYYNSKKNFIFS